MFDTNPQEGFQRYDVGKGHVVTPIAQEHLDILHDQFNYAEDIPLHSPLASMLTDVFDSHGNLIGGGDATKVYHMNKNAGFKPGTAPMEYNPYNYQKKIPKYLS